ncbi:MAG: hypothetical protein GC150_08720 [Rhizobiales bacterium]|nr:hypothetical protein [Hyphomicrobiales bacterium]
MNDLVYAYGIIREEFASIPHDHWLLLGVITAVGMLIGSVQHARHAANRRKVEDGARYNLILRN